MQEQFFIFLSFVISCSQGLCNTPLKWAPRNLHRKSYITYINDAGCPSWTTRHPITKESKGTGTLILPRGTPFAFECGACFQHSILDANLTLITTGTKTDFQPLTYDSDPIHKVNAYTDCLVSYGITTPVTKSGKLECKLNRGRKRVSETLNFSTRKVDISELPERTIRLTTVGNALLQCPDTALHDVRNIMYVWHSYIEEGETPSEAKIVVSSLRKNITFVPSKTFTRISCSVYDILNPYKVWRASYSIYDDRSVQSANKATQGEWSINGQLREEKKQSQSSGFLTPVFWLLGIGATVTIIGVIISMGICKCTRGKSARPQVFSDGQKPSEKTDSLIRVYDNVLQ